MAWALLLTAAVGAEPGAAPPAWQGPQPQAVEAQLQAWLAQASVDKPTREAIEKLWTPLPAETDELALLEKLTVSLALGDPRAKTLVEDCRRPRPSPLLPGYDWLLEAKLPPLEANNLRLFYGRYLAQEAYYDEALRLLGELRPEDVVAPATLLFYQAVVRHRLLDREGGLVAVDGLLPGPAPGAKRYAAIARLMQEDLQGLQEDSLDHIARRMEDVRRRLGLGAAGPKVREVQDGVIASLDKLIKEIEDRQQQQSASAGGAGSSQPSQPAPDSRIMGGKGPGEVAPRKVGSSSGWGNLPPKEREEAMQQVGREFPAHYREIVEQYFRKLAEEGSPP